MAISIDEWTMGWIGLFAAAPVRGLNVSAQYYYVGLAMLLVLMLVALVKAYQMWEEIHDVEEPDSPNDLLKTFEEARAAGELDAEEFERVKRHLAGPATGKDKDAPSASSVPRDAEPPELA